MKCLNCKWRIIEEIGVNGFIGETIIKCFMCNEITGDMADCEDFEEGDRQ